MVLHDYARDSIDAGAASGFDNAAMRNQILQMVMLCGALTAAAAERLADPVVDAYNVRLGSQAFGTLYKFTNQDVTVEQAGRLVAMGSDIVKFTISAGKHGKEPTTLTACVQANTNYLHLFDMSFHHYFAWTSVAGHSNNGYWHKGPNAAEERIEHDEMFEFACWLLTHYNGTGKKFYLGNWEGDWLLLGTAEHGANNPTPEAVAGMRAWLNARQQAVDDAKRATPHTNVDVFCYAEVNRVRDAMADKPGRNLRLVNAVLPFVTNLDYVSYSSYDMQNLKEPEMVRTLDYLAAHLSTNKAATISGRRVFVGEYGFGGGGRTPEAQEVPTRQYLARLLRWGVPFALFWQVYNNEKGNHFCLIDPAGQPTPCYYLHQRFINAAKLKVAGFKQERGRLPTDDEFVALAVPLLEQPLPPPVRFTLAHEPPGQPGPGGLLLRATLAQGLYGDEPAQVRAYWGPRDGGTATNGWAHVEDAGRNTRFGTSRFSALLLDVPANAKIFYRFQAATSDGAAWAPATGEFTPPAR